MSAACWVRCGRGRTRAGQCSLSDAHENNKNEKEEQEQEQQEQQGGCARVHRSGDTSCTLVAVHTSHLTWRSLLPSFSPLLLFTVERLNTHTSPCVRCVYCACWVRCWVRCCRGCTRAEQCSLSDAHENNKNEKEEEEEQNGCARVHRSGHTSLYTSRCSHLARTVSYAAASPSLCCSLSAARLAVCLVAGVPQRSGNGYVRLKFE